MSPYLEDQFQFVSHLYRKPLVFTDKCDLGSFDWRYVEQKNCTDACVTLRMADRVGGRRRYGFMRGCLSDIIHYNRSAIRTTELSRTARLDTSECAAIRLRDLFVTADRFAFDAQDYVDLCTCLRSECNGAAAKTVSSANRLLISSVLLRLALFAPSFSVLPKSPLQKQENKSNSLISWRTTNKEEEETNDSRESAAAKRGTSSVQRTTKLKKIRKKRRRKFCEYLLMVGRRRRMGLLTTHHKTFIL